MGEVLTISGTIHCCQGMKVSVSDVMVRLGGR